MGWNIDAELHNADWTKKTWDLLGIDSKKELLEHLKESGLSLTQFKKLPVYQFNKDKIKFLKDL